METIVMIDHDFHTKQTYNALYWTFSIFRNTVNTEMTVFGRVVAGVTNSQEKINSESNYNQEKPVKYPLNNELGCKKNTGTSGLINATKSQDENKVFCAVKNEKRKAKHKEITEDVMNRENAYNTLQGLNKKLTPEQEKDFCIIH